MNRLSPFFSGILFALLIWMGAFFTGCQNDRAGETLIRSYESQAGVVTFKIPPALIGNILARDEPETREMFRNMESIKIILVDMGKVKAGDQAGFVSAFEEGLRSLGFDTLFMTSSEGQTVHVLSLEEEERDIVKIREIMILITGEDEFLGLSVTGDIDPDRVIEAAKEMQLGDFEF